MTKNVRPRIGLSPSLIRSPLGDPRDRQNARDTTQIAPPLRLDSQARIGIALDVESPLVTQKNGALSLTLGAGLAATKNSPPALTVRTSDSIVADSQGNLHARVKTSQVRDDSGIGNGTLSGTLAGVELVRNKDVAGGYPGLDARGKILPAHGAAASSVATLDSNIQVPGDQLGGASFGGAGTKVLRDNTPPDWGAVPVGAIAAHESTHIPGGSDVLQTTAGGVVFGRTVGAGAGAITEVPIAISSAGGSLVMTGGGGTIADNFLTDVIAAGGPTGDATHSFQGTYDTKGRLTAVASVLITGTAPGGSAGGSLAGTYPNPTLTDLATPGSYVPGLPYGTSGGGVHPQVTLNTEGRVTAISDVASSIGAPSGILSVNNGKLLGRTTAGAGACEEVSPGTGVLTFIQTPSSANLAAALTDETGSGAAVFATSPTLVTPVLGTPTSGNATNMTHTGRVVVVTRLTSGTSATFTPNALTTAMWVRGWGAGGGGGGAAATAANAAAGGGGGASGYFEKFYSSVAASYTYTIATGGAGGTAGANDGSAGSGATVFDVSGTPLSANQGSGGKGSAAGVVAAVFQGGGGGSVSTGGDTNGSGAPGAYGSVFSGTVAASGLGGSGAIGGGGLGRVTEAAGVAGAGLGSGGGGGLSLGTSNRAGGAGKDGLIIVEELAS